MTDNGAKALAERLTATFDGTDGQGYRLALVAEDGGVIPPPLPSPLADAILADGAVFLTAEEAERLRTLDVRRVVKAIENVAARHEIKKDPPTVPLVLAKIYGYSTTPDDMDAQIAAEYAALTEPSPAS